MEGNQQPRADFDLVAVEVEVIHFNPTRRRGLVVAGLGDLEVGPLRLPTGMLQPGEEPAAAAQRILQERLGIGGTPHTAVPLPLALYPERQFGAAILTLPFAVLGPVPNTSRTKIDFLAVDTPGVRLGDHVNHPTAVLNARRAVCDLIESTPIAPRLISHRDTPFTLSDLRSVYQQVLGPDTRIDPSNFARKVTATAGFLREVSTDDAEFQTAGKNRPTRGRPARRYTAGEATALDPPIRFRHGSR